MAYKFNKEKGFNGGASIPVDGYVCKIVAAPKYLKYDESSKTYHEVRTFAEAQRTVIPFDIVEGEYADFFKKKYDNDDTAGKKWKGTLTLRHPSDQDQYDTNERRYNSFGSAVMDSNPGYEFDTDKNATLVGKLIGIVFRRHEFVNDKGEVAWYHEAFSTYSVDDIRSKNFKVPKTLTAQTTSGNTGNSDGFVNIPTGDLEELPFA